MNSAISFVPCPISQVPKAVFQELQHVFDDIDADCCGTLTREEVHRAFTVNRVRLLADEFTALLDAMDPERTNQISLDRFVSCVYALSIMHREVSTAAVYGVFPDSEFSTLTATGLLRLRRGIWLVRKI
jgi:hypothetical protein